MLTLLTGLAAGCVHVVMGPDHLAALAPIAMRDRRSGVRAGAMWGLGHGAAVVGLGLVGISAGKLIDVQALSGWSEFLVGVLLVGVGLWSLRSAMRVKIHAHGHAHGGAGEHAHPHVHMGAPPEAPGVHAARGHDRHSHAAFGVGMLHGMAGAGHLFGVLPALALQPGDALVYLAAYLVGAVGSMAAFGGALGTLASRGGPRLLRGMMVLCGASAVVLGVYWSGTGWPG